ncbi:hypothetical protein OsJ_36854 [Oryza sativa Japonica Group]|uniref:Amino acid permease family protein n=3 Tax=Oryza sativa subsp. japonica TaxID=39947 RepID=Q2QM92_ORYSJ|nr:Amino acid permease family protein [Oryza sativa Japonica Group]EEE53600.1 hypothetical protein OsJ_36854 [Oryza sativa Japonica Group]
MAEAAAGGEVRRRGGCCGGGGGGGGLFPEESFASWGAYGRALMETGPRLVERPTARSAAAVEVNEVRGRSGAEMKRNLTWWDLAWFGVGAVIGAGIFVLTGQEARDAAGPAVVLSYAVSGVSAMLSVLCYTEFAIEIPVAGGSFAYLRVELGDFVAFIAAGNILLEYCIGGAAVARAWTSYFATLLNHRPNDFRIHAASLAADYSRLDPIAVAVIAVVCALSVLSTKASSRFNYALSIAHLAVLVFIVTAGLSRARLSNLTADFAPFGARGVFAASAVLFFAYVGFDAVSTMAEETRDPARDIPAGLVGAMAVTTAAYCALAATLCLMQPYREIDPDAPFSVAFSAAGMGWARYVVAFGALKGMTTVLLVSAVGQARYLTHIARAHMAPPCLARVHPRLGTPVNATVAMLAATAAIALFTDLGVLANLLSISTLFIFMLVAVALLVRRYYATGETARGDRNRLAGCLAVIVASSVATAAYWGLGGDGGGWAAYAVAVPAWLAATLFLQLRVPMARTPEKWGVPLVPWLPSASIFINIFLLGSIDGRSFMRFGVWTAALLAYYFFFGLHASYDTAKALAAEVAAGKVEEGGSKPAVGGAAGN